jgi:hypothetical protein
MILPSAPGPEMGGKNGRDVFVGEAVKSVAPYALFGQGAGEREGRGYRRLAGMKRGIEAGDLRNVRLEFGNCADRFEIVRLMQRRQRNESIKLAQHVGRDTDRLRISHSAVHHAMADCGDIHVSGVRGNPLEQGRQSPMVRCRPIQRPVGQGLSPGVAHEQMQRVTDALDFAAASGRVLTRCRSYPIERKLDARRSGIEHQNAARHSAFRSWQPAGLPLR